MTTIQDVFGEKEFAHREEYADLFAQVLNAKEKHEGEALAEHFAKIIESYQTNPLHQENFSTAKSHQYTRSYIGWDESGWESIICRWAEGAESSIHGHPDMVFYYVLEGRIEMPFYERDNDGKLTLIRTQVLEGGDYVFSHVSDSNFENMIHSVRALEPSLSLHIFSDDALRGAVYET